jgi:hypothetical protein
MYDIIGDLDLRIKMLFPLVKQEPHAVAKNMI